MTTPSEPKLQQAGLQVLRGFFMGAADIVPGVSGGTVALILGIYKQLIANVKTGSEALKKLVTWNLADGLAAVRAVEWAFLIPLGTGIVAAFLLLRHWMEDLLVDHGEGLAAVFCGLVFTSCVLVWRSIRVRDATRLGILGLVAIVMFLVLGAQAGPVEDPSLPIFFATGAIAICAMILPGISGSFIMLILGMYWAVLVDGSPTELLIFAFGAIVGLALFSPPLNWLLVNHEQTLLAVLLGLMVGSYRLLWPWPNGVGDFGENPDEFVNGTDLGWPSTSELLGGLALAAVAAVVTLTIVHFAEARPSEEQDVHVAT